MKKVIIVLAIFIIAISKSFSQGDENEVHFEFEKGSIFPSNLDYESQIVRGDILLNGNLIIIKQSHNESEAKDSLVAIGLDSDLNVLWQTTIAVFSNVSQKVDVYMMPFIDHAMIVIGVKKSTSEEVIVRWIDKDGLKGDVSIISNVNLQSLTSKSFAKSGSKIFMEYEQNGQQKVAQFATYLPSIQSFINLGSNKFISQLLWKSDELICLGDTLMSTIARPLIYTFDNNLSLQTKRIVSKDKEQTGTEAIPTTDGLVLQWINKNVYSDPHTVQLVVAKVVDVQTSCSWEISKDVFEYYEDPIKAYFGTGVYVGCASQMWIVHPIDGSIIGEQSYYFVDGFVPYNFTFFEMYAHMFIGSWNTDISGNSFYGFNEIDANGNPGNITNPNLTNYPNPLSAGKIIKDSTLYIFGGIWDDGETGFIHKWVLKAGPAGVEDLVSKKSKIIISPNPMSDIITVEGEFSFYEIIDMQGKIVVMSSYEKCIVSGLKPGIYGVNVYSKDRVLVGSTKLIKQ